MRRPEPTVPGEGQNAPKANAADRRVRALPGRRRGRSRHSLDAYADQSAGQPGSCQVPAAWSGGARAAGCQTGYHPQRTALSYHGPQRTERQLSGVGRERRRTVRTRGHASSEEDAGVAWTRASIGPARCRDPAGSSVAGVAGYQTGYHRQRTVLNFRSPQRTERQVSGVCDERWRTAMN
jgi:hypothetical protein